MLANGRMHGSGGGQRFLKSMSTSAAPVEFQQVNVKLPSSQNLDFIHSTSAYKLNTNRWLEEITKNSEVVAKTFEE